MGLAIITFFLVAGIIVAVYWVAVARPEAADQAVLRRRLKSVGRTRATGQSVRFEKVTHLSDIPALNAVLAGSAGVSSRTQALLERAGLTWTVGRLVLLCAVSFGTVFVFFNYVTGTLLVALLVGLLAATMPYFYVRHRATRRMRRFEELFPEALSLIVRALRAGHAFTTGLAMVAEELSEPVGPEFRLVYDHQNFGMPIDDALGGLTRRIPLLDVKFFVTAVLTQREAGGNLAEILENIAAVINDRFKVKRQVRVVTAHARITGAVLAGLPPVSALAMLVIAPEHMKILWTDPLGIRLILMAIVLQIIGAFAIRKIVDIEY